jgi:hypothetical protein
LFTLVLDAMRFREAIPNIHDQPPIVDAQNTS